MRDVFWCGESVKEGDIASLLDWESTSCYPEFWEYTMELRFVPKNFCWYEFLMEAGGAQRYLEESERERALTSLTADSYSW